MRYAAMTLCFLVALLLALAVLAPSTLLDQRLSAATQGQLRLTAARGTLWRGSAALTDATGAWSIPVDWRVERLSLAGRGVAVVLEPLPNRAEPRGRIALQEGTVRVDGLSLVVPARALDGAFFARGVFALGGDLTLDAPAFAWSGAQGSGALNLRWRSARVANGGSVLDLGTVALDLAPHEDRLAGRLVNEGGDIRLAGNAEISGAGAQID